jgi:hypothetical protein
MRLFVSAFMIALAMSSLPASATAFCDIKPTADGFVALRATPSPQGKLIRKLKVGDDVQIDRTRRDRGQWMSVYYRGPDRTLEERGWVHSRLVGDVCG